MHSNQSVFPGINLSKTIVFYVSLESVWPKDNLSFHEMTLTFSEREIDFSPEKLRKERSNISLTVYKLTCQYSLGGDSNIKTPGCVCQGF